MDSNTNFEKENQDYFLVEDELLNRIINSFKIPEKYEIFDMMKADYNNYNKRRGIEFIKENGRIKFNDPYINLLLEREVENIVTPLEEWNQRGFVNNNPPVDAEKNPDITYLTAES